MSMLLDALRKSEKRQRAKSLPDIHAEAAPQSETRSGLARLLWPALALVGLLVVAIAAWYFWPPAADVAPQDQAPPGPAGKANEQAGVAGGQGAAAASSRGKPSSPVETLAEDQAASDAGGAGKAQLSEAERKAQREAERQARRKAERQAARQAKRESARQAQRQAATPAPAPGKKTPAKRPGAKQAPAADSEAQATATQDAADPAERPAAVAAGELQPISYWELPAAVRQQLPEMKISVLVFAEQPTARFVLMDGQRLVEGDQLQDGLTLQEVRRDGAVMQFKMYRFLVSHK